ncbi:cytochrome P450 [Chloroflexi bacterium TSY]|nr:cytochrome P450 [Chloroflexi bacterium TSY]
MNTKQPININSKAFLRNEYSYYKWMRENAPICKGRMGWVMHMHLVARYDDAVELLKDKRFIRNRSTITGGSRLPIPLPKAFATMAQSMIIEDEPEHRRLRNLVHKAFTPRTVANLEERIETLSHELLDKAAQQGTVDLLDAYALAIPITVIAEMIGVPKEDQIVFNQWSKAFVRSISIPNMFRMYLDVRGIVQFIRELIEKRRADPGDDLLTALIQAEDEGEQLNEDELLSMVVLLLIAGYETTVNLIANGTHSLLLNPEQLTLLREQPEQIDSAVEEIVRHDNPVAGTKPNYAIEDVELGGVTIPKGSMVMPLLASANRDERIFDNPDAFDITRSPNKHIGFGQGIHYCLGAPLARLEGKIAITNLVQRFPNLKLAVDPSEVRFVERPFFHRLQSLPVQLN